MSYFNKKQFSALKTIKNESITKKKEQLNECLETNSKIPHNLRGEAKDLLDDMIYNESEEQTYSWPNIIVTTSHDPSNFLKEFSKHFSLIFNGKYLARSKLTNDELMDFCSKNSVTHVFIINEAKGKVSSIKLSVMPYGKTYSFGVHTNHASRRTASLKENVYLICDAFTSEKIGKPLLFDIQRMFPKVEENNEGKNKKFKNKKIKDCRVCAFINKSGTIIFKHYFVKKNKFELDLSLDLNLYKVSSGTFDMEGDVEYQVNGYKNIINYDVI